MSAQSISFNFVVAISLIFGENDPRTLGDVPQPLSICSTTSEEIAVSLELYLLSLQCIQNWLAVVQILIEIDDEISKQQLLVFPNGLPLQLASLRGHIP